MAERLRRGGGIAAALAALLLLAGFGRPVGDFGRAEPDVLHDDLMPAAGSLRAKLAGEPVSSFNRSDEEIEMANRMWRFETSGHARNWYFDTIAELERTRLMPPPGPAFAIDRYYRWLHYAPYRSAAVRYATISDDVKADLATIPDTFAAICKVEAVDRQRQVAAGNLDPGAASMAALGARLAENDQAIGRFTQALRYRYQSYGYALDHLLVETPDPAARDVDPELGRLGASVHVAERGDFCDSGDRPRPGNPRPAAPVIPSRFVHGNPPAERSGPTSGS